MIVRNQGPRACGMPELHQLTPALSVLLDSGLKVALVTDGRMSGASGRVRAAIDVTPEVAAGGALARVLDGDIVTVDERRFVTILGRAKRFSKIAGEMVSLTAIEMKLQQLYPDYSFGVVGVPDDKKGEHLVCYTTLEKPDRKAIVAGLKELGCTELMIPKIFEHVAELPVLGTGKTDYVGLGRMARAKVEG